MDAHAQWEIRDLAGQMAGLARAALPRAAAFLGGKDAFPALLEPKR
jgi:thymidylate synthase ThyX